MSHILSVWRMHAGSYQYYVLLNAPTPLHSLKQSEDKRWDPELPRLLGGSLSDPVMKFHKVRLNDLFKLCPLLAFYFITHIISFISKCFRNYFSPFFILAFSPQRGSFHQASFSYFYSIQYRIGNNKCLSYDLVNTLCSSHVWGKDEVGSNMGKTSS